MLQDLTGPPANPSSVHWFGQQARARLIQARNQISSFFQIKPEELIFTSGGTESINYFLRGLTKGGHLITTSIEHSAIFRTVQELEKKGRAITYVPVGPWGAPNPEDIEAAIRSDTQAIVLSAANAETGVKIDIEKIATLAKQREIPFFLDAVSFIGKEPFSLAPGITALALSGHKFHAPKGIGALILRNLKLLPAITGGGQEHQLRAGTENLAGILGLAEAVQILKEEQETITQKLLQLRDTLEKGLFSLVPDIQINGEGPRISNTSNIAFSGVDGETLLMLLDMEGISVSHGSACSSGSLEPSRVLLNMGLDRKRARSSIRITLSRLNNLEEIEIAVTKIVECVKRLRQMFS